MNSPGINMITDRDHFFLWTFICGVFVLFLGVSGGVLADDTGNPVTLFEKARSQKGDRYWAVVQEISEHKDLKDKILKKHMDTSSGREKIAAAYNYYLRGFKDQALDTLIETLKSSANIEEKLLSGKAIWKLTNDSFGYENIQERVRTIKKELGTTKDPRLKIELARAVYGLSGFDGEALRAVEQQLNSNNENVRLEAALALVEMEEYQKAKKELEKWSDLPTDKGTIARSYLDRIRLQEDLDRMKSQREQIRKEEGDSFPVLSEIQKVINQRYVSPDEINRKDLIRGAAEGMVGQLDRFSDYLTEEEYDELTEDINLEYGGIGAIVSMRDDWLTIEQPIYDGPAYKSGLRSGDQIVEVKGKTTHGKTLKELVNILKGKPGTTVRVEVMRGGWVEPHTFEIKREKIQIDTARYRMLPGNIGYVEIMSFGQNTAKKLRSSITSLKEKGMKSLILDFRGNPGGFLGAALKISDLFLPKDKLVLTVKGRGKTGKKERSYYTKQGSMYDGPLTILVNEGSASASEIISGVMQDHDRGTIVGSRTYGKGSVQHLVDLESTGGNSAVKITWAKYYLPSGRSIHRPKDDTDESKEWGIRPDITVEKEERDFWFNYASANVRDSKHLKKYWEQYRKSDLDRLKKLVVDDGQDWRNYPGFKKLYKKLDTKLNKDNVRRVLRSELRRRVADERGKAFILDIQEDIQIQRSIVQALEEIDADVSQFGRYEHFSDLEPAGTENGKQSQENQKKSPSRDQ